MALLPRTVLVRVAHGLYRRWEQLAPPERSRLAGPAEEVKRHALELRGRIDAEAAEAGLASANERLARDIAAAAERDPAADAADVARLRTELSRELARMAQRDEAA